MMVLAIWALSAVALSPELAPAGSSNEAVLLEMHREVLRDHMTADVEGWLAAESEDYVVAGRGEVTWPTKKERLERIGPYLRRTKFKEYRDLIPPIVRVSKDGTLGWLICQIRASGIQTSDAGKEEPISFVSAWIELYEKRHGRWSGPATSRTSKNRADAFRQPHAAGHRRHRMPPMAWDSEEVRKGREDAWFRQNEEKLIEAARKKRESAEKERSSAEAEERRRAHWQKCPKCGGDMKVEKISGIEIEKCSSCEGVFFDRGELEELLLKQEPQRRGFFRKLMGFGEG